MTLHPIFVYGSLLDPTERLDALGTLAPRCRAVLPDRELAFTRFSSRRQGGVLDVRPRLGQVVDGLVFMVDDEQRARLDRREGHPGAYRRVPCTLFDARGEVIEGETYEVRDRESFVEPAAGYLQLVRAALRALELGTGQLDAAAGNRRAALSCAALFVYGTLLRGESRFSVLAEHGLTLSLLARCPGRLLDLGDYPGLMLAGPDWVEGELIHVERFEELLPRLDAIEGFRGFGQPGSLYQRRLVDIDPGDGRVRQAWTYAVTSHAGEPVIPSGDWRAHRGRRASFLEALARAHARAASRKEAALLKAVLTSHPFPPPEEVFAALPTLAVALAEDLISERRLAQVSGAWALVP